MVMVKKARGRDVWCIKDGMTGRYFRGFSGSAVGITTGGECGNLPMMGGARQEAHEFDTQEEAARVCLSLPVTILADVVKRRSRR